MSICDSGIKNKLFGKNITITVPDSHPLIELGNRLPWEAMYDLVENDLKDSTPSKTYHRGRKIKVRIHLGAYLLQKLYDLKDRQLETSIKENAAHQVFCGYGLVDDWFCPDHSAIERFRSRLTPVTQQKLANLICQNAVKLGIADASDIDIDSTVQEANMTYPTDPKMLRKLGGIVFNVAAGLKKILPVATEGIIDCGVNIKEIASKARKCFFLKKKASREEKSAVLSSLLASVTEPVLRVIEFCKTVSYETKQALPWNVKRAMNQLLDHGAAYLSSVQTFIETGTAETAKRLSFHLNQVSCFSKKKDHKKYEFGRSFQLIRLKGNFLFAGKCTEVRMDDKKSLLTVVDEFETVFGKEQLNSVATDKGYYGANNIKGLIKRKVNKVAVQVPANTKNKHCILSDEEKERLSNRRAGIEPLIGHAKQGGQLGRSRMKNDQNIESSGYGAILGFNLRQTIRAVCKKDRQNALF